MDPVYYKPPEDHERHMLSVWKWLAIFFSALAVSVAVFVLNAHRIVVHLPFSAEQRFVRPYESLSAYFGDQPDAGGEVVRSYLQVLAGRLAQAMGLPEEFELKVHFLDRDEINAFATLGGHIFVFRGLIDALPDENSIAMVLAHEIAHVRNRDPIVTLGRGFALQVLYSFVTGTYRGSSDVAAYGGNLGLLHFSREQERAADELAVETLAAAYGHAAGRTAIFELMRDREGTSEEGVPEWLSTHPDLRERIREIDSFAASRGWVDGPVDAVPAQVRDAVTRE